MAEDRDVFEDDLLEPSTRDISLSSAFNIRPDTVVRDEDAQEDLKVISWPNKTPSPSLADLRSYSYRELGREGSYIYLIENGIDPGAPVRSPALTTYTRI
jgi:hypothetical protein